MSLWDYLGGIQKSLGSNVKNENVPSQNNRVPFGPTLDVAKNLTPKDPYADAYARLHHRAPTNEDTERLRQEVLRVGETVLGFVGKVGGKLYEISPIGQLDKMTGGQIQTAGKKVLLSGQGTVRSNYAFVRSAADENVGAGLFSALNIIVGGALGAIAGGTVGFAAGGFGAIPGAIGGAIIGAGTAGGVERKVAKTGAFSSISKRLAEDAALSESAVGQEHYNFGRDATRQLARIKGFKTLGDTSMGIGAITSGILNFTAEVITDPTLKGASLGGKVLKSSVLGAGVVPKSQGLIADFLGKKTGIKPLELADKLELEIDLWKKTAAGETTKLSPLVDFIEKNDAVTVSNHPMFKGNDMAGVAGSVLAGKSPEVQSLVARIGLGDVDAVIELSSNVKYADTLAQLNRYDSAIVALEEDGMIWFRHDNNLMMVGKKYQDGAELIRAEFEALGAKREWFTKATSLEGWLQADKGASPFPWIERLRADKAVRSTAVKLSAGNRGLNPLKWKGVSQSELVTGITQQQTYGKMVTAIHKTGPLSAMVHIVSRAVDDVPHQTVNFNEGIKSTTSMRTNLRLSVAKNIITEQQASGIMNDFLNAADEGTKYSILEKYHETVLRNAAINYGHVGSSEIVEAVVSAYIKNHRLTKKEATLAQIKSQAYMVGKDGEAILDPQLISQLANGGFLPDVALIDKAFKEFSLTKPGAWLRAGRLTAYSAKTVADELQALWRNGTLMRGGFTANIMRDVNVRAWGDMSLFSMYSQLTQDTLGKISNSLNTVKNVETFGKDVFFNKRNLKNVDYEIDEHSKFLTKLKATLEREGYYNSKKKPKVIPPELARTVEQHDKIEATLTELRRQRQAIIDKIPTRVIQKDKVTVPGWDIPLPLGKGSLADISRSQLNGKEGMRAALASMRELEISNLRRGTTGAEVIFAIEKPKEHIAAWLNMLNDHLPNDPLAVKIMEGKMDRYDLMNWLREDAQRNYIDRFGVVVVAKGERARRLRPSDAEYIIDRVQNAIDSVAAHPEIQKAVLSGKVTAIQLEKLYPKIEERPPIAGDVVTAALGTSNIVRKALNVQKDVVTWLATTPTAKLNYNHYFAAKYYEKFETLIMNANERGILPDAAKRLQYEKISRSYAINEYRNKINAFSKDMNFAGLMNYVMAFFPAVVEQFRAYGRIMLDNPEFPIRLAYAASIPEALGEVKKDSYGNSYIEYAMPFTGIRGRFSTDWFNVVNPTSGSILSPGPAATTIARLISKQNDFAETQLGNFFMPFGSNGNILTSYTPNTWKKFIEMANAWTVKNSGQLQKDKEMLLKEYLYNYLAENGNNMPNNSTWNILDAKAEKKAQYLSVLRLGAAFTMPSQPKLVTAISYYQDRFNEAIGKDPVNGGADFVSKNPEYFMLADKLTNSVSGIFPDKTAVELLKRHPKTTLEIATALGNNFTALGAVFNDSNFAFSASAEDYLLSKNIPGFPNQKFKETQGSRESMQSTIVNKGWDDWFKLIEVVSTAIQKPEYNLDPSSGYGATVLQSYKNAFIEQQKLANPMWYDEKTSATGGGDDGKQAAVVKAITIAANTPAMWKDLSQQPRWFAIVEYMNFRYTVQSELKLRGVSYGAKSAQDVKEMVNRKIWELKRKDVQFAKFYERYFGNDDFSFTYDYAPPSGSK